MNKPDAKLGIVVVVLFPSSTELVVIASRVELRAELTRQLTWRMAELSSRQRARDGLLLLRGDRLLDHMRVVKIQSVPLIVRVRFVGNGLVRGQ